VAALEPRYVHGVMRCDDVVVGCDDGVIRINYDVIKSQNRRTVCACVWAGTENALEQENAN
jgi:hypothetical protein